MALTLCLLALVGWTTLSLGDGERLQAALSGLWGRPELLGLFAATYTVAFYLRALGWRLLLPASPGAMRLFALLQIALLANHLFPTKAGEVARMGLLTRLGVPAGVAVGSTLLARLLDIAALCLIALVVGPLAGGQMDRLLFALSLPLAGIAVGVIGCFLLASGRLEPIRGRLPLRLAGILRQTEVALASFSATRLLAAFGMVLPSWLLEAGALWSMAEAAGHPLPLEVVVAATAFTIAFQGFQFTPGGLGVYEASLTGALALYGVDPGTGLALAVATHGLKFAYSYLAGFPCLIFEALQLRSMEVEGCLSAAPSRRWRSALTTRLLGSPGSSGWWTRVWSLEHVDLALPLLAYLLLQPAAWGLGSWWLSSFVGMAATAPLLVLGRCHHLPRGPRPLLIGVALAFHGLFGLPAPAAGLSAILLGAVLALGRRHGDPVAVLWPGFLVQSIAAGAQQPLAVIGFGLVGLAAVVLFRQWWLARRPLPSPGRLPAGSLVAILIPVHNEAATVASVVARVPRAILREQGFEIRIVVVDDGSTDGSAALAREAGADLIVSHPVRRGLGAALRTGLAAARECGAGAAVYLDGDGEYDPADVPTVAGPVLRGEADYVLGSRFPAGAARMRPSRRWGNRLVTALLSLLVGLRLRDGQTGFRAFGARALEHAEILHDYNYAQVLTLDLVRKGMRLAQVSIGYRTRRHGTSFIRYREYLRRVVPAVAREVLAP